MVVTQFQQNIWNLKENRGGWKHLIFKFFD